MSRKSAVFSLLISLLQVVEIFRNLYFLLTKLGSIENATFLSGDLASQTQYIFFQYVYIYIYV